MTRVLILFSDTGGGHRAASVAIRDALKELDPTVEVVLKDGLVEGGPWPLNRSPAIYAWAMRRARFAWAFFFHLWNGPFRARLMADLGYPATAPRLKRMLREAPADVVVSTHPLLTRSVARALRSLERKEAFAVVVTDLVTGHWSWYDRGADRIFVPTPEAFDQVTAKGIPRDRLELTGQAVHPRCDAAVAKREEIRRIHGWTEPVVLLVGGGDGMGDLGRRVRALAEAALPVRLVVVCGRNRALRESLEAESFDQPVEIKGFVDDLPELMAGADVLVTKGGPGSIMEGCVAGLPILVYDYLPGQETGNIRLVEARGAGHYVPDTAAMITHVREWIDDPDARRRAAEASRAMSVPDSATRIARGILALAAEERSSTVRDRASLPE